MFKAVYALVAFQPTSNIHEINHRITELEDLTQIERAEQGYSNHDSELEALRKKRRYEVAKEFSIQLGVSAKMGLFF